MVIVTGSNEGIGHHVLRTLAEDGYRVAGFDVDGENLRSVSGRDSAPGELAKMSERLEADPDSGLLGYQSAFMGLRNGAAIQYWRSLEVLQRFAHDPDGMHVPAWRWLNEAAGSEGGIGFWAELYVVEAGNVETFYRDTQPVGLGEVKGQTPATASERRLGLSRTGVHHALTTLGKEL